MSNYTVQKQNRQITKVQQSTDAHLANDDVDDEAKMNDDSSSMDSQIIKTTFSLIAKQNRLFSEHSNSQKKITLEFRDELLQSVDSYISKIESSLVLFGDEYPLIFQNYLKYLILHLCNVRISPQKVTSVELVQINEQLTLTTNEVKEKISKNYKKHSRLLRHISTILANQILTLREESTNAIKSIFEDSTFPILCPATDSPSFSEFAGSNVVVDMKLPEIIKNLVNLLDSKKNALPQIYNGLSIFTFYVSDGSGYKKIPKELYDSYQEWLQDTYKWQKYDVDYHVERAKNEKLDKFLATKKTNLIGIVDIELTNFYLRTLNKYITEFIEQSTDSSAIQETNQKQVHDSSIIIDKDEVVNNLFLEDVIGSFERKSYSIAIPQKDETDRSMMQQLNGKLIYITPEVIEQIRELLKKLATRYQKFSSSDKEASNLILELITQRLASTNKYIDKLTEENELIQVQIDTLNEDEKELNKEVQKLEEQYAVKKNILDNLNKFNLDKSEKINQLRILIQDTTKSIDEAKSTKKHLSDEVKELETNRQKLKKKQKVSEHEVQALLQKKQMLAAEMSKLDHEDSDHASGILSSSSNSCMSIQSSVKSDDEFIKYNLPKDIVTNQYAELTQLFHDEGFGEFKEKNTILGQIKVELPKKSSFNLFSPFKHKKYSKIIKHISSFFQVDKESIRVGHMIKLTNESLDLNPKRIFLVLKGKGYTESKADVASGMIITGVNCITAVSTLVLLPINIVTNIHGTNEKETVDSTLWHDNDEFEEKNQADCTHVLDLIYEPPPGEIKVTSPSLVPLSIDEPKVYLNETDKITEREVYNETDIENKNSETQIQLSTESNHFTQAEIVDNLGDEDFNNKEFEDNFQSQSTNTLVQKNGQNLTNLTQPTLDLEISEDKTDQDNNLRIPLNESNLRDEIKKNEAIGESANATTAAKTNIIKNYLFEMDEVSTILLIETILAYISIDSMSLIDQSWQTISNFMKSYDASDKWNICSESYFSLNSDNATNVQDLFVQNKNFIKEIDINSNTDTLFLQLSNGYVVMNRSLYDISTEKLFYLLCVENSLVTDKSLAVLKRSHISFFQTNFQKLHVDSTQINNKNNKLNKEIGDAYINLVDSNQKINNKTTNIELSEEKSKKKKALIKSQLSRSVRAIRKTF